MMKTVTLPPEARAHLTDLVFNEKEAALRLDQARQTTAALSKVPHGVRISFSADNSSFAYEDGTAAVAMQESQALPAELPKKKVWEDK